MITDMQKISLLKITNQKVCSFFICKALIICIIFQPLIYLYHQLLSRLKHTRIHNMYHCTTWIIVIKKGLYESSKSYRSVFSPLPGYQSLVVGKNPLPNKLCGHTR